MALIRKRRLTQQQHRRIQQQQQRNTEQSDENVLEGLIVQHYGRQLEVKLLPSSFQQQCPEQYQAIIDVGEIWRCHTRTNLPALVTGDRVKWQADVNTGLGVITALHPRQSLLTRPDRYHKVKPVASNIDLIVVVFAPVPEVAPSLIDRYLVACADADIPVLLLMNKMDLIHENADILNIVEEYRQLGYRVMMCQADGDLSELEQLLSEKTVVFVGQSGVGKSTLINALVPDAGQETNVISENSALGQHTTTSTRLIDFGQNSALIDSPGIREFGLWHLTEDKIHAGFPEIQPLLGQCRFRNCTHQHEKQCAVKDAMQNGQILTRRVESYLRLLSEIQAEHER